MGQDNPIPITQTNALSCSNVHIIKLEADPSKTETLISQAQIFKVFADVALDPATTKDKIIQSWKLLHGFQVESIDRNVFLFKFNSAAECWKISMQAPWSVLGHHLILRKWDPQDT